MFSENISFSELYFNHRDEYLLKIKKLFLLKRNSIDFIPRQFIITTETGSYKFNKDILKDSCLTITKLLKKDPDALQFHIDIKDEKKVMSKFEDLFIFKEVFFDLNEIEIIRKIVEALDLISCPDFMKPGSLSAISIRSLLKMDELSLINFLKNKVTDTLTIVFNGKEYSCNLLGVYSSEKISKFLAKDPKIDKYVYNFDYEGEFDFTIIQQLFNFEVQEISLKNINTFLKIAEDLQITPIIPDLKECIKQYENSIQIIDDKITIINRTNEIFDWLYHIKEITVEKVADNIIKSVWVRSKDDISELISIVLQVIRIRYLLHPYLLDLLIVLDKRSKDESQLKILMPLFVKRLLFSIAKSNLYCSFMYRLTKKGIVQMEDVINYIFENVLYTKIGRSRSKKSKLEKGKKIIQLDLNTTQNILSWFLIEILGKFHHSEYIIESISDHLDIQYLLNYDIEDYKKMRDSGEPIDEITKAILHDDVEKLQSIVNYNKIDINERKIPRNIFQLSNNEEKSFINYAAECSSLKCFKYLFLNHANLDDESFSYAIYGGNTEIIRIVDQNRSSEIKEKSYFDYYNYNLNYYNNNIGEIGPFETSIITHQNDLFDWLLEHYELKSPTSCLIYSILNGNTYSYLCFVDKGIDFDDESENKYYLALASKEGFYNYMQLLQSSLKINEPFKTENRPYFDLDSAVSAGNLSILKLYLSIELKMNASLSLQTAIKRDYDDIVYYLVDNVYDPKYNKDIINILIEAASKETANYFNYIEKKHELKKIMITLNISSDDFIYILCFSKNMEVFQKLTDFILDNFTNPNFTTVFSNVSEEMCQYLIDKKVTLDVSSLINNPTAISISNGKMILKLINEIENLELRKNHLQKSLNIAIQTKNKNIIEFFLNYVEPNYESLICAIKSHDIEIVNQILKFNSESSCINHIDQYGTPLNIAVFEGDSCIVKRLLSIPNINPNLYDKNSVTPLMIAISRFNIEILNIFIDYFGDEIQNQIWQFNDGVKKILHRLSRETSKVKIKSNGKKNYPRRNKNHYTLDANLLKQFYKNKSEDISAVINRLIEIKNIDLNCHVKRYTLLTYACEVNDIDLLKKLILKKVDVNLYSPLNGNTPLITAIEACNDKVAEILIENPQTDINHKNMNDKTALVIAVENSLDNIVNLLLNDPKFDPKESLLDYAFYISSGTITQQLYAVKSLNVNYLNLRSYKQNNNKSAKGFETTLINAVNQNQMKKIDMIVTHPSFDPILSNVKEAIFESVKIDSKDIFDYLLNLVDNNVNIYNHRNQSLLFYSIITNNRDFLQLILNHDSFDHQKSNLFDSFLKASYSGYDLDDCNAKVDIMNDLLEYDINHSHLINFNELLPNGNSFFTSINPNINNLNELVQFYLDNNVDPNAPDRFGIYPLEYAILNNSREFIDCLLNSNRIDLSIRIKRNNNESFLHTAAKSKYALKNILSKNLFDINVKDDLGETPLMKACSLKNKENIIDLFGCNDLDYNHRNNMGDDALAIVRKNRNNITQIDYNNVGFNLNRISQDKKKYLDDLCKYL